MSGEAPATTPGPRVLPLDEPVVYPVCGTCGEAFMLRRVTFRSSDPAVNGRRWEWQRDCSHTGGVQLKVGDLAPCPGRQETA